MLNAPTLAASKMNKGVMDSAAEAAAAPIHLNAKEAIPTRQCLEEMGHPQPAARARAAKGFASSCDAIYFLSLG